ncbi:MAG TPA: hypothetical protein VG410_13075 [Solirubrobacteraceae bacterium]|nr:hypothetical protein [Solirubrobacteraceae bacterium]
MSTSVPPPNTPEPPAGGTLATRLTGGRNRWVAFAVAVIAIAVLAFVLLSSTSSKLDPVAQAATRSASAPGYRAHISMVMTSPALPGGITLRGGGVVASAAHAASISLTMTLPNLPQVTSQLGGNSLQLDEILHGTTVYVELPQVLASKLPFSKKWIAIDVLKAAGLNGLSSLSGGLSPTTGDPSQFLQYLRAASDSVVTDGHAQIDGYDTTHYQAQLDFGKVANALPASVRPAVQRALTALQQQAQLGTIPVDVWIDRSHLVRRFGMTLKMNVSGTSVSARITEDMSDYGPQATPAAPPADQVQTIN